MAAARADYLKRYLGGGGGGEAPGGDKKRRRKKAPGAVAASTGGIRVLDDDVNDWRTRAPGDARGRDASDGEEDAPVVEALHVAAPRARGAAGIGSWVDLPPSAGGGGGGGGDLSPPRRRGRHDSPDASPVRRGRHDSSPDLSPPRRGAAGAAAPPPPAADLSPPRRGRHDSSPDLSPPRRGAAPPARAAAAADLSPPRRGRHDSSPDLSPPRRGAPGAAADLSPPRRRAGGASPPGGDLSPPRRRPATAAADADLSPPRRRGGGDADGDLSPPRRAAPGGSAPPAGGAPALMTDGSKAGLVSGADVVAEARAKREREAQRLAALGDDAAGRGATTVFRDASGRALEGPEAAAAAAAARGKPRAEPERPAWGAGIAQRRGAEAAAAALAAEASAPFARFANDPALEASRRAASRWGDPLAGLGRSGDAQQQAEAAPPAVPGGDAEWLQRAGYKIPTEVPPHSWLRRRVGAPPNRYGIRPGRHWDGVDRGTGAEAAFVKVKADAATRERDAWRFVQSAYE